MKLTFSPQLIKKAERWVILLIGATVAITLGVTLLASRKSLSDDLASIPGSAIWLLAAAAVAQNGLRFWRYQIASRALRLNVPWYRMLYYYCVGYGLIPTPGKVGTAIRLWLLRQYHGLPYHRTAPLMVMDLVSDTIAMCALASLCLLLLNDDRLRTVGVLVFTALIMGLIATLIAPRLMARCVKLAYLFAGKRKPRLFARILALVRTTSAVLGPKVLLTTAGLSFLGWGSVGVALGHLVHSSGVPTFGPAAGTLAITLSTMGGFLTMMPAGVGGAEVTMAGLFSLFGTPFALAVLVTAITRLIVLWSTVLVGLILLPLAIRRAPQAAPVKHHKHTTTTTVISHTTDVDIT